MCKHSHSLTEETCAICLGYSPTYVRPADGALNFHKNNTFAVGTVAGWRDIDGELICDLFPHNEHYHCSKPTRKNVSFKPFISDVDTKLCYGDLFVSFNAKNWKKYK
jgi:hypothetical protein